MNCNNYNDQCSDGDHRSCQFGCLQHSHKKQKKYLKKQKKKWKKDRKKEYSIFYPQIKNKCKLQKPRRTSGILRFILGSVSIISFCIGFAYLIDLLKTLSGESKDIKGVNKLHQSAISGSLMVIGVFGFLGSTKERLRFLRIAKWTSLAFFAYNLLCFTLNLKGSSDDKSSEDSGSDFGGTLLNPPYLIGMLIISLLLLSISWTLVYQYETFIFIIPASFCIPTDSESSQYEELGSDQ